MSALVLSEKERKGLQKLILNLSFRISCHSQAMKPFIRFSTQTRSHSRFFWDFDDLLQKTLLKLLYKTASPEEIPPLCVEQWENDLEDYYEGEREIYEQAVRTKAGYDFSLRPRDEFLIDRIQPGGSLLYLGCGSGRDCLRFAKRGLRVIGIDTNDLLVGLSNKWAEYLNLPFKAVCMDAMDLDFEEKSFDGFLLEFYGSWPSVRQTMMVQRKLARILNPEGKGFVSASRKKYPSFIFLLRAPYYSAPMRKWLREQSSVDFYFSAADASEERLLAGLYNRSHTTESLTTELKWTFDVLECAHEEHDPRYVVAVVRPKGQEDDAGPIEEDCAVNLKEEGYSHKTERSVREAISKVEMVCSMLEAHEKEVAAFFESGEKSLAGNPLVSVKTDLSGFVQLLTDIASS